MKTIFALLIAALAGVTGNLEAREAVISSYELTLAPSDKAPGSTLVHIEGFAEAKAEGCEASRAIAKLNLSEDSGKVRITADVSPRLIARRVPCAPLPVDFKGLAFEADFELTAEQLETAELSNVKSLGTQILLANDLKEEPSPDESQDESQITGCETIEYFDLMCTMEYKPTTCRYGDESISAGNPCVARGRIQQKICASEGLFAPEELTCSSGEAI
ncbi:MAG: hypothetical protein EOP07_13895 [Proteobacteria bacterium]|nr:MAG: hypothetical protein EOP07_13895 [Pseudomonadota bacterium]